jgi:hypothetical protein
MGKEGGLRINVLAVKLLKILEVQRGERLVMRGQSNFLRLMRPEKGARLLTREHSDRPRTSRALQEDRGERSLSSWLTPRYSFFSLGHDESGERSLIDGLPGSF